MWTIHDNELLYQIRVLINNRPGGGWYSYMYHNNLTGESPVLSLSLSLSLSL